jgi:hypothetical protein
MKFASGETIFEIVRELRVAGRINRKISIPE